MDNVELVQKHRRPPARAHLVIRPYGTSAAATAAGRSSKPTAGQRRSIRARPSLFCRTGNAGWGTTKNGHCRGSPWSRRAGINHRMPGEHEQIGGPAFPGHVLLAAVDPAALALAMSNEPRVARPCRLARPVQVCRAADGLTLSLAPSLLQVPPGSVGAESCPLPPSATELLVGVRVGTMRLGSAGERFRPYDLDQERAAPITNPAEAAEPPSRRPIPQQHETRNP